MTDLVKVTARLPRHIVRDIDRLVEAGGYAHRSEAVRAALRHLLEANHA